MAMPEDVAQSITMTLPVAARRAGIGYTKARELARQGKFPGAFQLGRMWRVHRATFEQEIERLARGGDIAEAAGSDQILNRALDEARFRLAREARR